MTFQVNMQYTVADMLNYVKVNRRTHQQYMLIVKPVLLLLLLGAAGYSIIIAFSSKPVRVFPICYSFFLFAYAVFYFFLDRIHAHTSLKLRNKTYGEAILCFDENGASAHSTIEQTQYIYAAFTELFYCPRNKTYYLYVNKRQAVVIPERCFTRGDPVAFGDFITGKTGLKIIEIK